EASQGRRARGVEDGAQQRQAEVHPGGGAHLVARGEGHGVELPARGERVRGEAGRLPRVRQRDQGAGRVLGGDQPAAAGKRWKKMTTALRILHLEDDPKDAELVQGVLESGGIDCNIARVETREQFLAALERDAFDLILADFSLPTFDGLSALKLAVEKRPELPFIFVSGKFGEEVAIEAVKIGATDYVLKERLSRIVSSVRRALREAHERTERKQAEEQLRLSEAFLAEAQRISLTGSWAWVLSSGK